MRNFPVVNIAQNGPPYMAPSGRYNSASGDLFRMKLAEDIEKKLGKTMQALFACKAGFVQFWLNSRMDCH